MARPLAIVFSQAHPEEATWEPLVVGSPPAGGAIGIGTLYAGWQLKAGTLVVRLPAAEASSRDGHCHLSDGEGASAGVRN